MTTMTVTQFVVRADLVCTVRKAHELAVEKAARVAHGHEVECFLDPAPDRTGLVNNRMVGIIEDYIREMNAAFDRLQARMIDWSPQDVVEKVA